MRSRIAALVLGMCLSAGTQAEPTATVTWLMNEPMSLFDWGVYKADKKAGGLGELGSRLFTARFMSGSAAYDWDANRLRLRVFLNGNGTDAECVENLKAAKHVFLDFTVTGNDQATAAATVFGYLFSHEGGYRAKSTPAKLGHELANIATIEATIFKSNNDQTLSPKAKCQADFRSNEVRVLR